MDVAPVMPLDFGNGFIAAFANAPIIISDHDGLYAPEWDLPVYEYANIAGGRIGPAREQSRLMTLTFAHDRVYTVAELRRMFNLTETFTLTSENGSMPYRVVNISFPKSMLHAEQEFSITIRSPWAYPVREQAAFQMGSSSALTWPLTWPLVFESMDATDSIVLVNDGSVRAEPVIELKCSTTGTLTVSHPDGTIALPVTAGDQVSIDSTRWTVERNGITVLPNLATNPVWPVLRYGANTITFSQPVTCVARWDVREIGII